jgi:hypothetical protein
MAFTKQVVIAGGTPVATLLNGPTELYGLSATNSQGTPAIYYVKFYWQGVGAPPPGTSVVNPVVGTTLPQLTIPVPVGGLFNLSFDPMNNGGPLWYWVTLNALQTDATAIATGGDVLSFILG